MGGNRFGYHTVRIALKQDTPISMEPDSGPKPLDFETVDVSLQVRLVKSYGDLAEIEKFGERSIVPSEQLSEEPRADRTFSALELSPYTSLEDVIEEVSADEV